MNILLHVLVQDKNKGLENYFSVEWRWKFILFYNECIVKDYRMICLTFKNKNSFRNRCYCCVKNDIVILILKYIFLSILKLKGALYIVPKP